VEHFGAFVEPRSACLAGLTTALHSCHVSEGMGIVAGTALTLMNSRVTLKSMIVENYKRETGPGAEEYTIVREFIRLPQHEGDVGGPLGPPASPP